MSQRTRNRLWWMFTALYGLIIIALPGTVIAYSWALAAAPDVSLTRQAMDAAGLLPQVIPAVASDPGRFLFVLWDWYAAGLSANGIGPWPLVSAIGLGLLAFVIGAAANPYDPADTTHGSSRLATMADLKRWRRSRMVPGWVVSAFPPLMLLPDFHKRESLNLLDSSGVVLGRFRDKLLRTSATLSTLVLAAPGTGKTTGVAIPTLLAAGNEAWSMVIFDIKGELYDLTAGWRAKHGPVFRFDPKGRESAKWNPLSPTKSLPRAGEYAAALIKQADAIRAIWGPHPDDPDTRDHAYQIARAIQDQILDRPNDWRVAIKTHPAQLGALQIDGEALAAALTDLIEAAADIANIQGDRQEYIVRVTKSLLPEPKSGDKFWTDKGQGLLQGLIGFHIAECEYRMRHEGVAIEPSLGGVLHMWTNGIREGQSIKEADAGQQGDGEEGGGKSATWYILQQWLDRSRERGYPPAWEPRLQEIQNNPEKTRESIISTMMPGLDVFALPTVRDNTSSSDFSIDEIRGIAGQGESKPRPITVYIVVSLESLASMGPIMTMMTEAFARALISQPAAVAKKATPVLFLLDEFAQIPKMECLLKGPAVGRGQRVAFLLIAQSEGQIEDTYGKSGLKQIIDTTAMKVVLGLTDTETAKRYSELFGKTTTRTRNRSMNQGAWFSFDGWQSVFSGSPSGGSMSESTQGIPLFDVSDLMTQEDGGKFPPGTQLVAFQNRGSRPVLAKKPQYFLDKSMTALSAIKPPANDAARGFCGPLAHLAPAAPETDRTRPVGALRLSAEFQLRAGTAPGVQDPGTELEPLMRLGWVSDVTGAPSGWAGLDQTVSYSEPAEARLILATRDDIELAAMRARVEAELATAKEEHIRESHERLLVLIDEAVDRRFDPHRRRA